MGYKQKTKANLITEFNQGNIGTEDRFSQLARSIYNTEDTGSHPGEITNIGPPYLKGMLTVASGSGDEFNLIAPPFVPNLHPYIKVFNFDNYTTMVSGSLLSAPNNANKNIWHCTKGKDVASTVGEISGSFAYGRVGDHPHSTGCLRMKTDDDNNDTISLGTVIKPFQCISARPWWVKTSFNVEPIDANNNFHFFFGLHQLNVGATVSSLNAAAEVGKDRIGFVRFQDTSNNFRFTVTSGSEGSTNTAFDNVNLGNTGNFYQDKQFNLGIHWDGINSIKFYASIHDLFGDTNYAAGTTGNAFINNPMKLVQTHTTNIPITRLNLQLAFATGTLAVKEVMLRHIGGAVKYPTF